MSQLRHHRRNNGHCARRARQEIGGDAITPALARRGVSALRLGAKQADLDGLSGVGWIVNHGRIERGIEPEFRALCCGHSYHSQRREFCPVCKRQLVFIEVNPQTVIGPATLFGKIALGRNHKADTSTQDRAPKRLENCTDKGLDVEAGIWRAVQRSVSEIETESKIRAQYESGEIARRETDRHTQSLADYARELCDSIDAREHRPIGTTATALANSVHERDAAEIIGVCRQTVQRYKSAARFALEAMQMEAPKTLPNNRTVLPLARVDCVPVYTPAPKPVGNLAGVSIGPYTMETVAEFVQVEDRWNGEWIVSAPIKYAIRNRVEASHRHGIDPNSVPASVRSPAYHATIALRLCAYW